MSVSRSPSAAAVLSFVLPGLGQLAVGSIRRGLVVAVPALAVLAAGLALGLAGPVALLETLLRPDVLVGLLALNFILAAYHLVAIADAFEVARRLLPRGRGVRRASVVFIAALLAGTVALHGAVAAVGLQAYSTLDAIFVPSGPGEDWSIPMPSFSPSPGPTERRTPSPTPTPTRSPWPTTSPSPTPTATPTPPPTPALTPTPAWAADGRLNLLLVGSDAGPDRWSLRTDTLIVLSVQVGTGRAALFGIPRNMVGVPLPPESAGAFPNGRFPGMLNALYVYAMGHGSRFPGGDARGFRAVTGAVQELVGVPLDGAIVVNLAGFVQLVDALGGLWIDVPERLVDRNYPLEDGSGLIRLDIPPGCRHLDGRMALAYARSRHQDSDYGRMHRQQLVLRALATQVDPIALLPKVPDLLGVARRNLWTTIAREDVAGLADLAATVDTARIKGVTFVPPSYPSHLTTAEIGKIGRVVRHVFDGPPPSGGSSGASRSCP
ncbi:MAG TPA: LCP family protein [Candidatus Limnocylindrales bacterium]|nr:LCP family protein [Candidatus Limnocylindrales bacterium]